MGYSFQLAAKVLLCASCHRQDNTHCRHGEIDQRVHHEGSIWWPITPWVDILQQTYTSLLLRFLMRPSVTFYMFILLLDILRKKLSGTQMKIITECVSRGPLYHWATKTFLIITGKKEEIFHFTIHSTHLRLYGCDIFR